MHVKVLERKNSIEKVCPPITVILSIIMTCATPCEGGRHKKFCSPIGHQRAHLVKLHGQT